MSDERRAPEIVLKRVAAVVDRLDVAMQFTAPGTACAAQALHAANYAMHGPPDRSDDDFLPSIEWDEAYALVVALLPFVNAARRRPGPEGPL